MRREVNIRIDGEEAAVMAFELGLCIEAFRQELIWDDSFNIETLPMSQRDKEKWLGVLERLHRELK